MYSEAPFVNIAMCTVGRSRKYDVFADHHCISRFGLAQGNSNGFEQIAENEMQLRVAGC